jgi:S1-C subfamily serine protease
MISNEPWTWFRFLSVRLQVPLVHRSSNYLMRMGIACFAIVITPHLVMAQDCSEVARNTRSSVVSIVVKRTRKNTGAVDALHGTGFIIDSEGHVLTTRSLFSQSPDGYLDPPNVTGSIGSQAASPEPMEYLTQSEIGDVAVLRFTDTSRDYKPIELGDPFSVQAAQEVCSVQFPLNVEYSSPHGTVTGKGATKGWWYSDIPYNPGSGGAPIFEARSGKLVGMVGVFEPQTNTVQIGYVVPINLADPFLHEFANLQIQHDAAINLARELHGLQPSGDRTASPPSSNSAAVAGSLELQNRGLSLLAKIWPIPQIPVCWENPSTKFTREMEVVREEVADTWEQASRLRFTGWQKCAPENRGIRVLIEDTGPYTKRLGHDLDGVHDGIVLNFTFENWAPECKSTPDLCIKGTAGHTFGHAIGFGHTQSFQDAPASCKQRYPREVASVQLTPYDPDSIMNYCNVKFYNDGELSELDKAAVRILYGAPEK